jgi:signal transduction histidine kinase
VALLLPHDNERLVVEAVSGLGAEHLARATVGCRDRESGVVTLSGPAEIIDDLGKDSRVQELVGAGELGPGLIVPLAAAGQVLGTLVVARARTGLPFRAEDLRLVSTFAGQAALALELSRAQADRALLAVYEDRDRIARDLHDVVIQRLFAAGLTMQSLRHHLPPEAQAKGETLVGDLDDAIRDLRTAIFSLQEPGGTGGVRARILEVATSAAAALGFDPQLRLDGPLDTVVPETVGAHLLAVVNEALSNAARHAAARTVTLTVVVRDGILRAEIADDGIGFARTARSSGLSNMRSRAEQLGGSLEITSAPGAGTRVCWHVPLPR